MDNTQELIREARKNGQEYIQTQIQFALAADQRALSLGAISAAASSILIGFALEIEQLAGGVVLTFLSVALAISCLLAFYSARPVNLKPLGNRPASWKSDIESDKPISAALSEDLWVLERSIQHNSNVIEKNAAFLKAALLVSGASVFAAAIAGLFVLIH
jgi:hypothetical protein